MVVHSPDEGHLGYIQFGATVDKAVTNTQVHAFVWTHVFISLDIFLGTYFPKKEEKIGQVILFSNKETV